MASYLEFNNVSENYFYNPGANELKTDMVKIPFSKSEIFMSQVLSFKEKRQLVKTIEMCLLGTDIEEKASKLKTRNSTHEYDKDISLTEEEKKEMLELKD